MIWLNLAIAFPAALVASLGGTYLASAWKRLKRTDPAKLRIEALLPGYDCSLCGRPDCRAYACDLDSSGADPSLCLPGGRLVESRIRALLSERPGDSRSAAKRAVVRCGARGSAASKEYRYDGRRSCATAAELNGGPLRCKDGCMGFGSCVGSCPLDAIRIEGGVAVVNPARCTGCGACLPSCPTGVLSLIPRSQSWYVACASRREPPSRSRDCSAACTGCGECRDRSIRGEFSIESALARENPTAESGRWEEIAECCPAGVIIRAGSGKKRLSPFPARER
jgi:Na+-translocating ferredoxin:NAD+ oxidoreductase subunit B